MKEIKEILNRRNTGVQKIEIDKNITYDIEKRKLRKKLESIMNIRVVLALTYLKEYYLCT